MKVSHPVCFPDLSLSDFQFFGYAKEQMKDVVITDEYDLDDKPTEF
jgi:hypothetical protein